MSGLALRAKCDTGVDDGPRPDHAPVADLDRTPRAVAQGMAEVDSRLDQDAASEDDQSLPDQLGSSYRFAFRSCPVHHATMPRDLARVNPKEEECSRGRAGSRDYNHAVRTANPNLIELVGPIVPWHRIGSAGRRGC